MIIMWFVCIKFHFTSIKICDSVWAQTASRFQNFSCYSLHAGMGRKRRMSKVDKATDTGCGEMTGKDPW